MSQRERVLDIWHWPYFDIINLVELHLKGSSVSLASLTSQVEEASIHSQQKWPLRWAILFIYEKEVWLETVELKKLIKAYQRITLHETLVIAATVETGVASRLDALTDLIETATHTTALLLNDRYVVRWWTTGRTCRGCTRRRTSRYPTHHCRVHWRRLYGCLERKWLENWSLEKEVKTTYDTQSEDSRSRQCASRGSAWWAVDRSAGGRWCRRGSRSKSRTDEDAEFALQTGRSCRRRRKLKRNGVRNWEMLKDNKRRTSFFEITVGYGGRRWWR